MNYDRGPQGVTGVTEDNMGPLVRSHDDYRHPRVCKLSLILLNLWSNFYSILSSHKSGHKIGQGP